MPSSDPPGDRDTDHELLVRLDERVKGQNEDMREIRAAMSTLKADILSDLGGIRAAVDIVAERQDRHILEETQATAGISERLAATETIIGENRSRISRMERAQSNRDVALVGALVAGCLGLVGSLIVYMVR